MLLLKGEASFLFLLISHRSHLLFISLNTEDTLEFLTLGHAVLNISSHFTINKTIIQCQFFERNPPRSFFCCCCCIVISLCLMAAVSLGSTTCRTAPLPESWKTQYLAANYFTWLSWPNESIGVYRHVPWLTVSFLGQHFLQCNEQEHLWFLC